MQICMGILHAYLPPCEHHTRRAEQRNAPNDKDGVLLKKGVILPWPPASTSNMGSRPVWEPPRSGTELRLRLPFQRAADKSPRAHITTVRQRYPLRGNQDSIWSNHDYEQERSCCQHR